MSFLSPKHALWLAGFRPFFILACLSGIILPCLWGLTFSGYLQLPSGVNALQWHAHEFFYGFGGAVLFGFLLTASKNWVKVRGVHGIHLMIVAFFWILDRGLIYYPGHLNLVIKHVLFSLYIISCASYIWWTLVKHHKTDFFKDNYFFLFLLPAIVIAKNLLVSTEYYQYGLTMSLGLFRLAFVVMFERTLPQFMQNTESTKLFRNKYLDFFIKFFAALSVFESFYPKGLSVFILLMTAILMLIRWFLWVPFIGFKKFGNGIMYFGYLFLVIHLIFEALKTASVWSQGAYSVHIFTFLCMGVIIPSMLVRIANGHTGRKPRFLWPDKIPIYLVILSAIFRLILPITQSSYYPYWILAAGLMWSAAYIILSFRIMPFLVQPRIDGKVH